MSSLTITTGGGVGVGGVTTPGPGGLVLMIPFGPSIEMSRYSTSPSCTCRERDRETASETEGVEHHFFRRTASKLKVRG